MTTLFHIIIDSAAPYQCAFIIVAFGEIGDGRWNKEWRGAAFDMSLCKKHLYFFCEKRKINLLLFRQRRKFASGMKSDKQ